MSWPIVSDHPDVQAHYERCREEGTSHTLAEMFALAQPPQSRTDREFLRGHCNGSQFAGNPAMGDYYKAVAEAEGQDTKGKVYLSGLADYPGDPRAWVDGRGDVQKVCEERGWGCAGAVNLKVRVEEPVSVAIDEALVQQEVEHILTQVPDPQHVDTEDLAEQVREKRKPHWEK